MSDEICTYIALALSLMVVILKVVDSKKHLFNGNKYENTVLKQRHIDEILDATWGKKEEDNDNADNQNGTQSFSVVLISVPNQYKISVLKEIREITFLGLKEAKDIIESTPYVIKENISNSEARNIKNILERAGAEVVIR